MSPLERVMTAEAVPAMALEFPPASTRLPEGLDAETVGASLVPVKLIVNVSLS